MNMDSINSKATGKEEDDPINEKIPVYLTKKLDKQLFLFQYPLRPATEEPPNVAQAAFKPLNKEVKLDVAVNTRIDFFDTYKAEQLAQAVNSSKMKKKEPEQAIFNNGIADKVFYTSTKVTAQTASHAVGVFNGSGYYLTPLEGYLQLKPSLNYLNHYLNGKKLSGNMEGEDADVDDPENVVEAVTVKFGKNDAKDGANKDMSYQKFREISEQEKWVDCDWNKHDSHDADFLKTKLMSADADDTSHLFNIKDADYVRLLVPEDEQEVHIKPSLPCNVVSLQALKSLSLQEQVRLLLKDAKILQFEQLKMLLTNGDQSASIEGLITTLPQIAVMVKGNWVIRSQILYPENTFSSVSGVASELMCRARDYVLYLFTKNQYVERRKVTATVRLPAEEVKEIFTGVAKLKHTKGWELLVAPDEDFMHKYPEACQRQSMVWEQRWQQLNEFYKDIPKEKRRRKSKSFSEDQRKSDKEDNESSSPAPAKISKKDAKNAKKNQQT